MKKFFFTFFLILNWENGFSQEDVCNCDTVSRYITSNTGKKIKELYIRQCDSINFDISNLWIEKLSISGKYTVFPSSFIFPKQVKELYLNGKELHKFPSSIRDLDSLRILWLNNCRLMQVDTKALSTLKNLKELKLNGNFFDTIDDHFFNNTAEYISLENCHIKCVKLHNKNNSCKVLQLQDNQINHFEGLNKLTSIVDIDISFNSLEKLPFIDLKQHNSLESIELDGNKLTQIPNEFSKFKNLTYVRLNYNKIKNISKVISNLKFLMILFINENKIEIIPEHLFKFDLKLLYVKDNPIKHIEGKDELLKIKRESVIITDDKNEYFRQFVKNYNICYYYYNERNSLISSCPEKEKNARELFIFFEKSNYK